MRLTCLLSLCAVISAQAQPQNATWYFGHHAGLKFNGNNPPTVLTDGALTSRENATCISDTNGNILLYSDGGRMYNKFGQVVDNGDSLYNEWLNENFTWGNYGYWGGQGFGASILLPSFEGDSIYEMFTATLGSPNYGFPGGFVVNKINVNQNKVLLPKNQMLFTTVDDSTVLEDRIAPVRHANGRDWWLVMHRLFSDEYWTYLYDPYGVHGPYIQHIGQYHTSGMYIGQAPVNRAGNKIIWIGSTGIADLFDFDRCTGLLSNYVEMGFPPYSDQATSQLNFGEFSASSNTLYLGMIGALYQYDLTAPNPKLTETQFYTNPFLNAATYDSTLQLGMLKLGQDDKIYVAKSPGDYLQDTTYIFNSKVKYLGVINNPDVLGAGCNFVANGLYLDGKYSTYALPNTAYYLPALAGSGCDTLQPIPPPTALFNSNQQSVCQGGCVQYANQSSGASSYQWLFPNGNPSSSIDSLPPPVCYSAAGSYDATLIVTNSGGTDTLVQHNVITVTAPPVVSIAHQSDTLTATQGFAAYQWSLNGTALTNSSNVLVAQGSGSYSVTVTDANGCSSSTQLVYNSVVSVNDAFAFNINPNPAHDQVQCSWSNAKVELIELYDMLGRNVMQFKPTSESALLDVSKLTAGSYVLRATDSQGNSVMRKLTVE